MSIYDVDLWLVLERLNSREMESLQLGKFLTRFVYFRPVAFNNLTLPLNGLNQKTERDAVTWERKVFCPWSQYNETTPSPSQRLNPDKSVSARLHHDKAFSISNDQVSLYFLAICQLFHWELEAWIWSLYQSNVSNRLHFKWPLSPIRFRCESG